MSSDITIAFDVMGGDQGSRPCVLAAIAFAQRYPDTQLKLFGDESSIRSVLTSVPSNIHIFHAADYVRMEESPALALRHKLHSSMNLALKALAAEQADACVSAGNTGALMALARHTVKMLPGVKRPAICKEIPTKSGSSFLLDLGANIKCDSEHLVQFAIMGAVLAKVHGIQQPKVALLNVGSEITKGTDSVKEAAHMLMHRENVLSDSTFCYDGFIEGDELYSGRVDVIVCDGFTGNVALKVSEGLVRYVIKSLDDFFSQSFWGRVTKILLGPLLASWSRKKNPSLYNGAAFLGLAKTVVKSHGGADEVGLLCALEAARKQATSGIIAKMDKELRTYT